ncbi:MAG TPA: hypothetical protein VNZ86_20975, partial [Bacteroidia bacterium]|nr:hypothetical protein [Bacteroidia bacterium]
KFRDFIKSNGFKIVFILRNESEAKSSFSSMLGSETGEDVDSHMLSWNKVVEAFEKMRADNPRALSINYDDLDSMETIRQISDYCTGLPFDEARWKMMDEMKITAFPEKVVRNQRLIK